MVEHEVQRDALTVLAEFRSEVYACLTARSDALFGLCDALLFNDGPVRTLVDLALAPEYRRGHGACTRESTTVGSTVPFAIPPAEARASIRWCPAGPTRSSPHFERGRTSWTALLDAIWLEPGADSAAVTADQVRDASDAR